MDMIYFYSAESLWPYVTGEKDIPRKDGYVEYYRAVRNFGKLCAITSLQKASSNPNHRPIDTEFVDIYNGITKAILACIDIGQVDQTQDLGISMKKLEILAEYIGPSFIDMNSYQQGIQVVLEGNIDGVYVPDTNVVSEEYRRQVISTFSSSLLALSHHYGIDEVKKITGYSNKAVKSSRRSI